METCSSDAVHEKMVRLEVLVGGPTKESGTATLFDQVQTVTGEVARLMKKGRASSVDGEGGQLSRE